MQKPYIVKATFNAAGTNVVNATGSVTSDLIKLSQLEGDFSVAAEVTSAGGTPDVKVEYLVALEAEFDRSGYWKKVPGKDLITPEGAANVYSQVNDENVHVTSFTCEVVPFIAFKITGINSNPADTVVDVKLLVR